MLALRVHQGAAGLLIYIDDFGDVSPRWQSLAGTLEVNAGALRAATLGDWGPNLVTNGSMETGDPPTGWGSAFAALSSVAEERTGGAGTHCLNMARANSVLPHAYQAIATVPSATYALHGWIRNVDQQWVRLTAWDVVGDAKIGGETEQAATAWKEADTTHVCPSASTQVRVRGYAPAGTYPNGTSVRADDVSFYRQNCPALLRGWRSPAFTATMAHISPAAAVTPFGFICRYTDTLNYWEIRVLPNTAGNDLQIIQVTAGVETVRAEADIDWTAGDTDELSVTAQGSTISTAHKKSGAGVWTAGPSYASATQGQTSPHIGAMLYETGVDRLASLRVVRA